MSSRGLEGPVATFVLIHGGWHGGWCWKKVAPLLRAQGHAVFAPTLTGLGDRRHLASADIDLTTHIQDVVGLLDYEDLEQVILVGHSYGGMVIAGVAQQAPERLQHLVYLDAFVPADGQAQVDLLSAAYRQQMEQRVAAEGEGWYLPSLFPVPWDEGVRKHWLFTDEADVQWVVPRLTPQPFKTMTEPVRGGNPAGDAVPKTFIRCTEDPRPDSPLAGFAALARAEGSGWRYREIATGHDAMVTKPGDVAESLLELVWLANAPGRVGSRYDSCP
jgi:pimeloyl-ACP methyl ester carboxylesterase